MPAWEWILIVASLAIPVTAVAVAMTLMRDSRQVRAVAPVALSVPSFAKTTPVASASEAMSAA